MRIVICGGHHNSALVVAEKLRERGHEVLWFGHKYSMIGDEKVSAEFLEVTKKKIPFIEIRAGKFQPYYFFWQNLFRIPTGFLQSLTALLRIRPNLIVSFGGYLALPVTWTGYLLKIPIVTHEQTTVSGLGNKLIAKVAKKVFITFSSSAKYFPKGKVVLTGLPIRESVLKGGKKLFDNSRKTIYITGGKQGAHVINEAVFKILPDLLERFNVIHQCGSTTLFNDIQKAEQIKCSLGKISESYIVNEYFFDSEIGSVFKSADFVVSRAGAHTIYELMVLNKPAILIPIPWSSNNEQEENAKMLASAGLAEILSQKEMEEGKLLDKIFDFEKKLPKYHLLFDHAINLKASEIIIEEIENILKVKGNLDK